ncbi:MAG: MarR family EPS-associated transcriptional regulator [Thermodesulfobacteriota bacterium]|nr:MarR family EPS-associated transcriptional regulator [Thermodesulfobacteriota bacterium]
MNNRYEQEIRYRLLKILSQESKLTQRDMAKKAGISLGKVNYCLSELAKKGLIKVIRFKSARDKRPYTYILTPRGLEEKAKLTVTFLRRKINEYKEIRRQISELTREINEDKSMKISEAETLDMMRDIP